MSTLTIPQPERRRFTLSEAKGAVTDIIE